MPDIWFDMDAALAEVPVNIFPLLDDTDFKTREVAVAYNAAGMDLVWNFVTTAGAFTQTAVTPTTGGNYDWAHQGDGMYTIEIPASGGASINNDTEGFGWFTGVATGVLPWRGPVIGFRAAALNNALIDGGDTLDVNVTEIANGAITAGAIAADAITAAKIADGAIDIAAFAADVKTGNYLNAQVKGQDNIDFGALQKASLNAATPASVVGAVGSVTGNVGGNVIGSVGSVSGNVGGNVVGSVASVTAGVTVTTNNDKTGYALSSAGLQAIWDVLLTAITTAGSIGKLIKDYLDAAISSRAASATALSNSTWTDARAGKLDNLDATISSRLATAGYTAPPSAGTIADAVWREELVASGHVDVPNGGAALVYGAAFVFDTAVGSGAAGSWGEVLDDVAGLMEADGAVKRFTANALEQAPGGAAPSAAAIADAVWDEALADHAGAGSAGEALAAAGTAGDPWIAALPGAYGAGTAGKIIGDNLDAAVSSRLEAADYSAAPSAAAIADAVWDEVLAGHAGTGSAGAKLNSVGNAAGSGAIECTLTIDDGTDPIDGCEVWVTTEPAGSNVVASGTTNEQGQVTFWLDAGAFFLWKKRAGFNFTNPEAFTVTA